MIKNGYIWPFKVLKITVVMALIGVISGELMLQGLSLIVRASGHSIQKDWLTTNTRVLALGDSFVYGLYLPQNLSWPAQLQEHWNNHLAEDQQPIEVLNLGFPGTNSARILANINEFMQLFRPDLVLIMVGANDVWTPKENIDRKDSIWLQAVGWIRQNSRLYKLWYMAKKEASFQCTRKSRAMAKYGELYAGRSNKLCKREV